MYDAFINIFKANNIPFEEYSFSTKSGYYKEIKVDSGILFFDEYDELINVVDNSQSTSHMICTLTIEYNMLIEKEIEKLCHANQRRLKP